MNRKRLSTCFVLAGLLSVPGADVPAGGATTGKAAPATAVSSADSCGADGATLPAGVTGKARAQAQTAIRELELSNRDVAAPSGARPSWKAEGDQSGAHFGSSVGTAGDVNGDGYDDVVIGAPSDDRGRAYVYHGSASGLSTTADWTAEGDEQAIPFFGHSVGTAGDVNGDGYDDVVVGEPFYDNPEALEGRAFVYHGSASGLSAMPDWTAESDQTEALFGYSVGTAGDVNGDGYDDVIVGAPSGIDPGRAYVYHGSASGLSTTPDWTADDQKNAFLGISVGTAGDVNGDGYDDVIVGEGGRAFVYHGSASGLSTMPDWTAESAGFWAGLVGTAGDVNGDGYDDVIVGAAGYCTDEDGGVFVYHGSASGLSTRPDWTAESDQEQACFGYSVGTAGDVNGDSYDDVVVGAHRYDDRESDEGGVVVYFGSASGLATRPYWTAQSDQAEALFGYSVGTAGDVNGDGYDDGIGGAPAYDHGQTDEGVAVVFHGRATAAMPR